MNLTVIPNEDGTININAPGSEEVTYDLDDINNCGLSKSEKRFLRDQLRHAVPGPTTCIVK